MTRRQFCQQRMCGTVLAHTAYCLAPPTPPPLPRLHPVRRIKELCISRPSDSKAAAMGAARIYNLIHVMSRKRPEKTKRRKRFYRLIFY